MGHATLNVIVVQKRMLTKAEAAAHCGRPVKTFVSECPVIPIRFGNGDIRYDLQDLDGWLDGLKPGHEDADLDTIIDRLD